MYKELEKQYNEMQEDPERITRERIASKCGELKSALSKVIKTLSSDADVSLQIYLKNKFSSVHVWANFPSKICTYSYVRMYILYAYSSKPVYMHVCICI